MKRSGAYALGMTMAALAAVLPLSLSPARAQSAEPDALKPRLNDGYDTPDAMRFDWQAFTIGTGQYEDGPTGLTVFRFNRKVLAAVDGRGGLTINPGRWQQHGQKRR